MSRSAVYIVIPCYNEEACIQSTICRLLAACPEVRIIAVNDGSTDRTGEILQSLTDNKVTVIDLPFNCGIGTAVQTGLLAAARAGAEYAVKFDGDGQHPAAGIADLLAPLQNHEADFTVASRFLEKNHGFRSTALRRVGIRLFYALSWLLTGHGLTDSTSGFRAYNRRALLFAACYYPAFDYPEPEENILFLRNGFRVKEVACVMADRQGGKSSIRPLKSVYYMVKVSLAMIIARFRHPKKEVTVCP